MASVSTSHLIIFVASLVVAAGVVGTLTTGVDRVSSAVQDGSLDVSQQVRTDVTIISDPGSSIVVENGDEEVDVTIHVRNTGSQTIPARESAIDMFLNGQFQGEEDFTIEVQGTTDNADVWRPDEVVEITITAEEADLDTDNRIFLTVNGDQEEFEFRS
ncbi:flagellar protein G [Natronocalculus amylovorans]|uniref:Flagellar protein G n=1 Tax=Natronocalculus amylovorans TaxID=2917812 RepID=A0AAE3FVN4_9EURY|nr:flagellar protein G [Natronocalculus amylovorans]MCL9816000.1 flagellar protein G [Natronocalculus amylovorans]